MLLAVALFQARYAPTTSGSKATSSKILGPLQGGRVHATALWDPRTGTLKRPGVQQRLRLPGRTSTGTVDAWLDSLDYLESLSPKRVIAGRSKPGLPEGANALEWTRRYINDFRTFAKMAKSVAEMTEMLRVRNPNAIGFPASDGLFGMSTEVADWRKSCWSNE